MMLEDGTIIPSYMGVEPGGRGGWDGQFNNFGLHVGEVREIIKPSDQRSLSGRWYEYNVECTNFVNGTTTSIMYYNCVLMSTFGGAADQIHYTLRESDQQKSPEDGINVGGKVLVMCIDGKRTKAVIIGGVRDEGTDPKASGYEGKDAEEGHSLYFEFNGVQVKVNKDGECTIKFRGATKVDGTLDDNADPDAEGSTLTFNKEGSIKLATKDEKQYAYLNHKDKKIEILADEEWNVKVNKKTVVTSGDNIEVHTDKEMKLDASNNVKITSSGVLVGNATDKWPLFSTYRQSESSMHQDFLQNFTQLGIAIGVIGASLTTASAAHAVPIAGPIIGAPAIAAAGSAAIQAAQAFVKLSAAVGQFEGKTTTYESTKNKND